MVSLEKIILRSVTIPNVNFLQNLDNLWSVDIKLGGIKNFDVLPKLKKLK